MPLEDGFAAIQFEAVISVFGKKLRTSGEVVTIRMFQKDILTKIDILMTLCDIQLACRYYEIDCLLLT